MLTVALPKGRIAEQTLELFEKAFGEKIVFEDRKLILETKELDLAGDLPVKELVLRKCKSLTISESFKLLSSYADLEGLGEGFKRIDKRLSDRVLKKK